MPEHRLYDHGELEQANTDGYHQGYDDGYADASRLALQQWEERLRAVRGYLEAARVELQQLEKTP